MRKKERKGKGAERERERDNRFNLSEIFEPTLSITIAPQGLQHQKKKKKKPKETKEERKMWPCQLVTEIQTKHDHTSSSSTSEDR